MSDLVKLFDQFSSLVTWKFEDFIEQVRLLRALKDKMPEPEYKKLFDTYKMYLDKLRGLDARFKTQYETETGIVIKKDTRIVAMDEQKKFNEYLGILVGQYLGTEAYNRYQIRIKKHELEQNVGYGKL